MHPKDFQTIVDSTIASLNSLVTVKGGEYASDADRLANFKEAGKRLGLTPEQVLLVYLDKHYSAVVNYVKDMIAGKNRPRSEPIGGRADDMVVYLMLFKALLEERHELSDAVQEEMKHDTPSLDWED